MIVRKANGKIDFRKLTPEERDDIIAGKYAKHSSEPRPITFEEWFAKNNVMLYGYHEKAEKRDDLIMKVPASVFPNDEVKAEFVRRLGMSPDYEYAMIDDEGSGDVIAKIDW